MYNTKPNPPTKQKHQLRWFESRVGKEITLNNTISLFEPPILIASKDHAKALYTSQYKNYTYE